MITQTQVGGFAMTSWARREFETLAEAIAIHLETFRGETAVNEVLAHIQQDADAAANTAVTTEGDLIRCRTTLCAVCRAAKLYECDVSTGWSFNCAFLHSNTTYFGQI
jgi:hypothetical protein